MPHLCAALLHAAEMLHLCSALVHARGMPHLCAALVHAWQLQHLCADRLTLCTQEKDRTERQYYGVEVREQYRQQVDSDKDRQLSQLQAKLKQAQADYQELDSKLDFMGQKEDYVLQLCHKNPSNTVRSHALKCRIDLMLQSCGTSWPVACPSCMRRV